MNFAVIADDLTGANDTGVQMARQGLATSVLLELKTGGGKQEAVVFDTDSRSLPPLEAYQKVKDVCLFLGRRGEASSPVIYKKFDSTLRGNIGSELDAVYETLQPDFVVIAPSFPRVGRTLADGIVYVNGMPLHETEMACDPKHPATESAFSAILERQSRYPAALISLEQLRGERAALDELIAGYRQSGIPYLVFDAEREEDLALIASLFPEGPGRPKVVWAGSAGLAGALTGQILRSLREAPEQAGVVLNKSGNKQAASCDNVVYYDTNCVLIVVGSVNPWSRRQLTELVKEDSVSAIVVESDKLLFPSSCEMELNRVRELVTGIISREGKHVALYTSGDPDEVDRVRKLGRASGLSATEVGKRISAALGRVAADIIAECGIRHMVLTGGDTAKQVCRHLSDVEIKLIDEVENGVPLGRTPGESGRYIITKAGAFGSDQVLVRSVKALQKGVT
ncbi:four-carbon acid sugar kinase family protein [Paenibacillus riograndensis]|uniref:Type III effector Hrp-dependent outer protein n=1 Tax=Paenibacillus riograndensis SBR5 TaxID=1073571 RepID=A0A0E4H8X1_9BACL|nr:four-carbon acid sugar kinase family protein [Paenibacillus riograndensis]CQR54656.1 type III effector Hrp-dependent outer protein [Paenibacillus riograndensis SBR5]